MWCILMTKYFLNTCFFVLEECSDFLTINNRYNPLTCRFYCLEKHLHIFKILEKTFSAKKLKKHCRGQVAKKSQSQPRPNLPISSTSLESTNDQSPRSYLVRELLIFWLLTFTWPSSDLYLTSFRRFRWKSLFGVEWVVKSNINCISHNITILHCKDPRNNEGLLHLFMVLLNISSCLDSADNSQSIFNKIWQCFELLFKFYS